jgi:hypothetical protein
MFRTSQAKFAEEAGDEGEWQGHALECGRDREQRVDGAVEVSRLASQ